MNWNSKDGEFKEDLIGKGWQERDGLPAPGQLKYAMVLRPAMLNDGECVADSEKDGRPYRAADGHVKGWSISRKDVAYFIYLLIASKQDLVDRSVKPPLAVPDHEQILCDAISVYQSSFLGQTL